MIPVRVAAETTVHVVRDDCQIDASHPLFLKECPVCDGILGDGGPVALVYVGAAPEDREGRFWTGAAVAVHASCAGPSD